MMYKFPMPSKLKRKEPLQAQIDYLTTYLTTLSATIQNAFNSRRQDEKSITNVYVSQGVLVVEWSNGKIDRYTIGGR